MIEPPKQRVLFVCIGNACRSQMAEAFAHTYGADVIVPASAGLAPASAVHPVTARAMLEKNIDLKDHFPKALRNMSRAQFDLVINMSGSFLPNPPSATNMLMLFCFCPQPPTNHFCKDLKALWRITPSFKDSKSSSSSSSSSSSFRRPRSSAALPPLVPLG